MLKKNQRGVIDPIVIVVVVLILLVGGIIYWRNSSPKEPQIPEGTQGLGQDYVDGVPPDQNNEDSAEPTVYLPTNYSGDFKVKYLTLFDSNPKTLPHYAITFEYPSTFGGDDGTVVFNTNFYQNLPTVFNPPTNCGDGYSVKYLKEFNKTIPCELYITTSRDRKVYAYMYKETGSNEETRVYYAEIDDYVLYIPVFQPQVSKEVISEFVDSFELANTTQIDKLTQ